MKQIVEVENMSCQNCVKHVTAHFLELEGVSGVAINLDTKEATVTTDVLYSLDEYQVSLDDTVYEAVAIKA